MAHYRIVATGPGVPKPIERTAVTAGGAEFHRDALRRLHGEASEVEVLGEDGLAIPPAELSRLARDQARRQLAQSLRSDREKPSGTVHVKSTGPRGPGTVRRVAAGLLTVTAFIVGVAAIGIASENNSRGLGKSVLLICLPVIACMLIAAYLLVKNLPGWRESGDWTPPGDWSPSDSDPAGSREYGSGITWGGGDSSGASGGNSNDGSNSSSGPTSD